MWLSGKITEAESRHQEVLARVLAKVICQLPQVESVRLSPVPSKSATLENRKHRRELQCWGGDNWLSILFGGLTGVCFEPLIHSIFIEYLLHAGHYSRCWGYSREQKTLTYILMAK